MVDVENKEMPKDVPYIVHETEMSRMDLSHKRVQTWLFGIIAGLILLLVGTNGAWLYYESQFEDVMSVTQEATADGNSDITLQNVGGDYYGGESATNGN